MDFGMSTSPYLPPSTGSQHSVNIAQMENWYNSIASSISDLARHQAVRREYLINDEIIATIEKKLLSESNDGDPLLINVISENI